VELSLRRNQEEEMRTTVLTVLYGKVSLKEREKGRDEEDV